MIAGEKVTAEHSGSNPFRILLDETTPVRLRLTTKPDRATKAASVLNKEWKQFLGHAMFGLSETLKGSAYGEACTPGFRSMFSYFARRDARRQRRGGIRPDDKCLARRSMKRAGGAPSIGQE